MMRRIAVVGENLERGGRILPYSGPVFSIGDAGHQVALIGGSASCEACKNIGMIAKAGGPRRINFMGETAADDDVVLCSCPKPPRIVAWRRSPGIVVRRHGRDDGCCCIQQNSQRRRCIGRCGSV